jgi:surfactin synthase thioesterase subunit
MNRNRQTQIYCFQYCMDQARPATACLHRCRSKNDHRAVSKEIDDWDQQTSFSGDTIDCKSPSEPIDVIFELAARS